AALHLPECQLGVDRVALSHSVELALECEVLRSDAVRRTEQHGALQYVSELPQIPGPIVPGERIARLLAECRASFAEIAAQPLEQPFGQQWNISAALSQRW